MSNFRLIAEEQMAGPRDHDQLRPRDSLRGVFLGLPHIDNGNSLACREAALQLTNLDPCRRIHPGPTEQTGQKCCHGELSEANQAVTQC